MNGDAVTIDGQTFAQLVGREGDDVYLFRVSKEFVGAIDDNAWHGPVRWRINREHGQIVELVMQTNDDYEALLADAMTLMDIHASDELKDEARHRIIERETE